MSSNEYHFVTDWRVEATVQEVAEILGHAPGLVRWWPSVYLDMQVLAPGDGSGVGRVYALAITE